MLTAAYLCCLVMCEFTFPGYSLGSHWRDRDGREALVFHNICCLSPAVWGWGPPSTPVKWSEPPKREKALRFETEWIEASACIDGIFLAQSSVAQFGTIRCFAPFLSQCKLVLLFCSHMLRYKMRASSSSVCLNMLSTSVFAFYKSTLIFLFTLLETKSI